MKHEIHGDLANADFIDRLGLLIGNHHYEIAEAAEVIKNAF